LKASDFIKRRFLILGVLILFVFTSSCQNTSFGTNNFQEVDFKDGQKVQLIIGGEIYNLFVTFNENCDFSLKYLPEASDIFLETTVVVKGEQAEIFSNELIFSKNINDFNNSFVPKIIYAFFKSTDFSNTPYVFDKPNDALVLKKNILEKNVVFTVKLTQDKLNQIYILELR
jgi:hypothetical protein